MVKRKYRVSRGLPWPPVADLNDRYQALVERKYSGGLTDAESAEMASISAQLSDGEKDFYVPIVERLQGLRKQMSPRVKDEALKSLTARETRVLELVLKGFNNEAIATSQDLTETSVKALLQVLFHKLGVRSRDQLHRVVARRLDEQAVEQRG